MFHEVWWKKSQKIKIPLFFISMATAAKFVLPIPISLAYLVPLDVDVTGNITAQINEVWSEFNIFWTLVTMATAAILNFCNPQKESKNLLNPPFLVSMAAAAKFVQTIPIFFGLSRSTRCGCFSYQVSSISVWRVTCYDHFCVFHFFFSILAISMATAAMLEKSTLKGTTSHGIW